MLVHVVTQKGKGYAPAESAADKLPRAWSSSTWSPASRPRPPPARRSYTKVFAQELIKHAASDDRRSSAITAAMPSGTGLDLFGKRFPDRTFDVGIAEQHAVTFAAGLAADGMKPFAAIYSTFLQRGYDQVRPRRGHPVACRCASPSTAPAWSAPTARPTRAPSTSASWARCPAWC